MRNLPLLVLLALAGCETAAPLEPLPMNRPALVYQCGAGTFVEARYIGADRAYVTFMERTMLMRIAPAASGVRYVGGGWQWWTKGTTEGTIAPLRPAERVAAAPGQLCVVPPRR